MEPTNTTAEHTPATLSEAKRLQAQHWIAEGIARGLTITEACTTAFVSRQTFYNWLDTDEPFRRRIAYAEDEAASEVDCDFFLCVRKAKEDPKYQRSLIYYLQRRERRRERQEDREHRAEQRRLDREHEEALRRGEPCVRPFRDRVPAAGCECPPSSEHARKAARRASPPRLTTPVRRGVNIPFHLRASKQLYRAATGPLSPVDLPLHGGDGHCFDLPEIPSRD